MSRITGKCDLADHVYMIGSKGTTDGMTKKEMFEIFKQRTNGTIYQSIKVPVTKFNIDFLVENDEWLERTDHKTYLYFGKEYKTLKQLDKAGVYYIRQIKFDTMLDLVPYLPYVVSIMINDNDHEYIEIGEKSYIDRKYIQGLEFGHDSIDTYNYDMKRLQEEYVNTIKELEDCM